MIIAVSLIRSSFSIILLPHTISSCLLRTQKMADVTFDITFREGSCLSIELFWIASLLLLF
jgi:hypothetical protein